MMIQKDGEAKNPVRGVRLNRFLARGGAGSRRGVEEFIAGGRVRVDGKVVLLPAYRVTGEMTVTLDGKTILPEEKKYILLNKPKGYVCSVQDPYDPVVGDLLAEELRQYRLFPVGRLDRESEGLLVLTNDGDFAQELLHPSKSVLREYEALLSGEISRREVRQWMGGVLLDGRLLTPVNLLIMDRAPANRWISIVLAEGVKREVRRMAEAFGYSVEMLIRRRIGKMELRDLPAGSYREMSRNSLWRAIRSGGSV